MRTGRQPLAPRTGMHRAAICEERKAWQGQRSGMAFSHLEGQALPREAAGFGLPGEHLFGGGGQVA